MAVGECRWVWKLEICILNFKSASGTIAAYRDSKTLSGFATRQMEENMDLFPHNCLIKHARAGVHSPDSASVNAA
jgi:hypothetical protein